MNRWAIRLTGNWLTSFLSPLVGTTTAFSLDIAELNTKILLSALFSSFIVTGLLVAKKMERYGRENGRATNGK